MVKRQSFVTAAAFVIGTGLAFAFTATFSGAVMSGCGSSCSSSNCPAGCCDSSGKCQAGSSASACGGSGNLCVSCPSGQTCTAGTCQAPACTGSNCNDAGNTPDSGPTPDAGPCVNDHVTQTPFDAGGVQCITDGGVYMTLPQMRAFLAGDCPAPLNNAVVLQGLTVTAVLDGFKASSRGIPNDAGTREYFWVAETANPQNGLWVEKFTTDWAVDTIANTDFLYAPTPGDQISINGFAVVRQPLSFGSYNQAYRDTVGDAFLVTGVNPASSMQIQVQAFADAGNTVLADNIVPSGFGNSQNGTAQANPEYAGARVHIPGPITITNTSPAAMALFQSNVYPPMTSGSFAGYEIGTPGGAGPYTHILVNDHNTYQTFSPNPDGGADLPDPGRCDYGYLARTDGGVTWPNGISGVWDTYAVQPCIGPLPDGGRFCPNGAGAVNFADSCQPIGYIYVLWPVNCNDLDGGGL